MSFASLRWLEPARRRRTVAYAVAGGAVLVATLLKSAFDWLGRDAPGATYLGAIMLAAWVGGRGPGLVATALSCIASAYLFLAPYDSLAVASGDDAVRLAVTAVEGLTIALLAGALREANERLRIEGDERVRAERALRERTEQLHHAQKMHAFGDFAGSVAHDVNNMATVVLASTDLLARRLPHDHPALAEAGHIRGAVERALELTRKLLTFARRQRGPVRRIELHDLLTQLRPMLERLAGDAIRLELSLEASRSVVQGEPGSLEQAIVNLAANARDAMPGGGTLTIATVDAGDASIGVTIHDTGAGMDEATRERAFEPFFTTKGEGAGTGLGLWVVFGVVETMGGSIDVQSAPRQGTTFRLRLPLSGPAE